MKLLKSFGLSVLALLTLLILSHKPVAAFPIPPDPGGNGVGAISPATDSGRRYVGNTSSYLTAGSAVTPFYDIGNDSDFNYSKMITRIYVQSGQTIAITIDNAYSNCYSETGGGVVGPDYTDNGVAPTVIYTLDGASGALGTFTVTDGGCGQVSFNPVTANSSNEFSITPTPNYDGFFEVVAQTSSTSLGQGENSYRVDITSNTGVAGSGSTIYGLGYRAGDLNDFATGTANLWSGWTNFALPISCNALTSPFSKAETVNFYDSDPPPGHADWNTDLIFVIQEQTIDANNNLGAWTTVASDNPVTVNNGGLSFTAKSNARYRIVLGNVGVRNTIRVTIPSDFSTLYSKISERPSNATCQTDDATCSITFNPPVGSIPPNSSVAVTIVATNSGTSTWNNTYYMKRVGPNVVNLQNVTGTVAPTKTFTFTDTVTAPGAGGSKTLTYRMYNNTGPFGTSCSKTITPTGGGGGGGGGNFFVRGCSQTQVSNLTSTARHKIIVGYQCVAYACSLAGYTDQASCEAAGGSWNCVSKVPIYGYGTVNNFVDIKIVFHNESGGQPDQNYNERINGNPANKTYNTFKDFSSQVQLYPHMSYTAQLFATISGDVYDENMNPFDPNPQPIGGPYQITPNDTNDPPDGSSICMQVTQCDQGVVFSDPEPEPGEPITIKYGMTLRNMTGQSFNQYSVHLRANPVGSYTFVNPIIAKTFQSNATGPPPYIYDKGFDTTYDGPVNGTLEYTGELIADLYFNGQNIDANLNGNTTNVPCPPPPNSPTTTKTPFTRPYFKVYKGEIQGGGAFKQANGTCTINNQGTILGFARTTNSSDGPKGASADFGAYALGLIQGDVNGYFGFYDSAVNGNANNSNTLSFANAGIAQQLRGGYMAGNPGSPGADHCVADYFDTTQTGTFAGTSNGNSTGVPGSSGQYLYQPTSGTLNITGGGVAIGQHTTIYVRGNVYISGNINYDETWSPFDLNNAPYLAIIVLGDINVAPGVTNLDGLYVAQNGSFATCGDPNNISSAATQDEISNICRNRLTVNGAVIADEVRLLRSGVGDGGTPGTLFRAPNNNTENINCGASSSVNCAAEVFNYIPAMVLGMPDFQQQQGTGSITPGTLQGLTRLPPVF